MPKVEYLSPPARVSMADSWFQIAAPDHFWIKRRFAVLQKLAGELIVNAKELAEIGCGHGLVQHQIETAYNREMIGFELNEEALKRNVSHKSAIYCYDICQKSDAFRDRFDLIMLLDVLEHIEKDDEFLQAVLYHLSNDGHLVINVPAGQWAHSAYDRAAGHIRRYSIATLRRSAGRNGLAVRSWTYWGLPLVPTLALRKFLLRGQTDESKIISSGFGSRGNIVNFLLGLLSSCEPIPQKLLGTSLMAVLEKKRKS